MINRKQLFKKVNKMRHFTVIADINVVQKEILHGDLSFISIYFIPIYVSFTIVKTFCNGICNFSNIFSIKNYPFQCKSLNLNGI